MAVSPAITRKPLLTAALGSLTSIDRVEVKQIDLAPGQATGLHRHPCSVVGYIVAGAINFQIDGHPMQCLHSGEAFYEPRDVRITHFDNASTTDHATFIAFYLLGAGEHELIEMLSGR
jgi:quercetin dioxygenase-like cupin family protein